MTERPVAKSAVKMNGQTSCDEASEIGGKKAADAKKTEKRTAIERTNERKKDGNRTAVN